jgi:hypothetical protein
MIRIVRVASVLGRSSEERGSWYWSVLAMSPLEAWSVGFDIVLYNRIEGLIFLLNVESGAGARM